MFKQLSAGVVVYQNTADNNRLYLLLQYPGQYWDFPKGKLEGDEDWLDAAHRETKEETGLDVSIHSGFEYKYMYVFNDFKGHLIEKTVLFFVGQAQSDDQVTISHEHLDYLWLSYEQARVQIHFDSVKHLLDKAHTFLDAQCE